MAMSSEIVVRKWWDASAISQWVEIDEALLCHACVINMWSSTANFEWANYANGAPTNFDCSVGSGAEYWFQKRNGPTTSSSPRWALATLAFRSPIPILGPWEDKRVYVSESIENKSLRSSYRCPSWGAYVEIKSALPQRTRKSREVHQFECSS